MSAYGSFRSHIRASAASALVLAVFHAGAAEAQIGADVSDPPVLQAQPALAAPAGPNEQVLDLNIEYVDGTIYNPSTAREDKVHLRSYTQPGKPPPSRYISPAIHTRPGQTVRVNLHNKLPADPSCTAGGDSHDPNTPHCFNGTNLHTHGLWVNPAGNGDNVLLSINPQVSFEYEYAIPPTHPAGTFWYHTHRHGSTAMQVSSGMAGALIIKGDRFPTRTRTGDLDTLLDGFRERILMFQQIQYYCRKDGAITYDCGPKDVGEIESYDAFGPPTWGKSGRYTSINGLILPTFRSKEGVIERWRMIHGGVRDTIALQFRKARTSASLKSLTAAGGDRLEAAIDQACDGPPLTYHLVAADGLTLAEAQPTSSATFQPGYRFDALVVFPRAGSYCVIDAASKAKGSVGGVASGSRLLGMVEVARLEPVDPSRIGTYLVDRIATLAERTMPEDVRAAVVADVRAGLRLGRFVPHKDIGEGELKGGQELVFDIQVPPKLLEFQIGGKDYEPRPYQPGRLDRRLTLGTAEEWTLTSNRDGHPFHIHVNPFQIVSIADARGRDVSGPEGGGDPQYQGLRGVWKDTLFVEEGYKATIRTRYERYIGEFVLHCHILDHEDRGMMQNVAIVLPGGTAESVNAPPDGGHANH
jgi:L-ascorbate oxidase